MTPNFESPDFVTFNLIHSPFLLYIPLHLNFILHLFHNPMISQVRGCKHPFIFSHPCTVVKIPAILSIASKYPNSPILTPIAQARGCKLMYTHTQEEIKEVLQRVIRRIQEGHYLDVSFISTFILFHSFCIHSTFLFFYQHSFNILFAPNADRPHSFKILSKFIELHFNEPGQ